MLVGAAPEQHPSAIKKRLPVRRHTSDHHTLMPDSPPPLLTLLPILRLCMALVSFRQPGLYPLAVVPGGSPSPAMPALPLW